MPEMVRGVVAEFIGTFALVFVGCGSIVLTVPMDPGIGLLIVACAFATVLIAFVTATMHISGAQFNPAVTIAFALLGTQSWARAGLFIVTQLIAAASAVGMMVLLFGRDADLSAAIDVARHGATLGRFGEAGDAVAVFGLELLQTFALMFVILAGIADPRAHKLGGFCVGIVVAACIFACGPLTGASLNPARSFGPALYGHWEMHWVFWAGPIAGAVLAAIVYRVFLERREPKGTG